MRCIFIPTSLLHSKHHPPARPISTFLMNPSKLMPTTPTEDNSVNNEPALVFFKSRWHGDESKLPPLKRWWQAKSVMKMSTRLLAKLLLCFDFISLLTDEDEKRFCSEMKLKRCAKRIRQQYRLTTLCERKRKIMNAGKIGKSENRRKSKNEYWYSATEI